MQAINVSLYVSLFLLVSHLQGPAHAYLDPGTGSMVLQLVMAGFVGGLAVARLYWRRVKSFLFGRQKDDDTTFGE